MTALTIEDLFDRANTNRRRGENELKDYNKRVYTAAKSQVINAMKPVDFEQLVVNAIVRAFEKEPYKQTYKRVVIELNFPSTITENLTDAHTKLRNQFATRQFDSETIINTKFRDAVISYMMAYAPTIRGMRYAEITTGVELGSFTRQAKIEIEINR